MSAQVDLRPVPLPVPRPGRRVRPGTPFAEYPPKGRATGGVRCQRFLKGEGGLIAAWAGPGPALGATEAGVPVDLANLQGRRDGSGTPLTRQLAHIGPPFRAV